MTARQGNILSVIAGLVPAIHDELPNGMPFVRRSCGAASSWMRGSSPRMTILNVWEPV
jgi:hypothetical protein